jgi:DNA-binding MarR family transcriptional regulator
MSTNTNPNDPSEDTVDWGDVGYVAASQHRTTVLTTLKEDRATPSILATKTDLTIAHVSSVLTELQERGLVELLVPESQRKGRIYALTDAGHTTVTHLDEVTTT